MTKPAAASAEVATFRRPARQQNHVAPVDPRKSTETLIDGTLKMIAIAGAGLDDTSPARQALVASAETIRILNAQLNEARTRLQQIEWMMTR